MTKAAALFIGRRQEMAAMCAALDSARAGRSQLILLSGEPGIGKTRLAAELADQNGIAAVWGRSHEEAGAPPYFLWAQVVRALVQQSDTDMLRLDLGPGAVDIAEIVPEIRDHLHDLDTPAQASDPAEARFRLFDSLTRFLTAVSRRRPLAIVLDDLHWADVPSLRFLEFLVPATADFCLLLIGTYRENELSRQHPLFDTLGGLGGASRTVRVHLAGLDAEEVRHFVALAAGVVPSLSLTRALHAQTEGNPLFLREVVRFLLQQGHFKARPEGEITPPIRIPEGVREVIGRRLNLLSASCNAVLGLAAVIGREFDARVLVRASADRDGETVLHALDEALDAHVLEETAPDRYQFTHALIRMTLYDELRTSQRRRLHHTVGEAIETVHRRNLGAVLPDLARHFHLAALGNDTPRAIGYAFRAGQHADAMLAFEDAIGFFQTALDMIEQMDEPDPHEHATLLLHMGDAQRKTNDFTTAKRSMLASAAMARRHGLHDLLAEVAVSFELAEWRHGYVDPNTASALLTEALSALPAGMDVRRIRVTGSLARARLYADAIEEAKTLMAQAIAMSRALGDPGTIAASLSLLTEFSWEPRETEGLLAAAVEMVAAAEQVGALELTSHGYYNQVILALELGDIARSQTALKAAIAANERLRQPVYTQFDLALQTTMAQLRGNLTEAEALIGRTFRLRAVGQTQNTDPMSLLVFNLRREQGRLSELRPLVMAFAQSSGSAAWRPGLALLHVEFGDLSAARVLFDDLVRDDFAAVPRDGRWTTSLVYLAEICATLDDAKQARQLYELLLPRSGRNIVLGNGAGCPGSANRFLGMLATTMGRWADAEHHFAEAMAMNQRIGALAPLGHTAHDFAAMLLTRGFPGDRDRALHLLHQAAEQAAALGLVAVARKVEASLARAAMSTPSAPDALTARELEVLRLLAIGRGNADIAMVLEISPNTVATHVKNIFAKTGCANRTEAAAYAMRHGLQTHG